jgi:formylglycine-generating enzyme required for sulfatase activity
MDRWFRKKFSLLEVIGLLVMGFLGVALYAYAVTIPHTFSAGTTAVADEVNENFEAVATAITDLEGAVGLRSPVSCSGNSASDIMVPVGPLCVDKYEASVWSIASGTGTQYGANSDNYPAGFPDTGNWSTPLYAVSKPGVTPSRHITWFQAQQACALSGKRLLTNAEWQMAAAGTPDDTDCNIDGAGPVATGASADCTSKWGANDMVGNVWEWVGDWMQGPDGDSATEAQEWAPDAYPVLTSDYGDDLALSVNEAYPFNGFPAALSRGGGYPDTAIINPAFDTDSGVFAILASDDPSSTLGSRGFRCAR